MVITCFIFQKNKKVLNKNPIILTHKKKYHRLENKLNFSHKTNKDIFRLKNIQRCMKSQI